MLSREISSYILKGNNKNQSSKHLTQEVRGKKWQNKRMKNSKKKAIKIIIKLNTFSNKNPEEGLIKPQAVSSKSPINYTYFWKE